MKIYEIGDLPCVSIGHFRDPDGDFAVLATLNNIDGAIQDKFAFFRLVNIIKAAIVQDSNGLFEPDDIVALVRQDAPDYLEISSDK